LSHLHCCRGCGFARHHRGSSPSDPARSASAGRSDGDGDGDGDSASEASPPRHR
jgi:hypothetical protein